MTPMSYEQFVEQFCRVRDPRTKKLVPMVLYTTQRRFARELFRRGKDRLRLYRRALYAAPKKTGKSSFIASIVLYHFLLEHEVNKEVAIFAWDLDQTEYLFNAIKGFILADAQLAKMIRIDRNQMSFEDEWGRHTIKRIARDEMGSHGGNPSMVVSDETWTLPDWSMVSALSFSPVRLEPLFIFTSYAGYESDMVPGRPLYDLWLSMQAGAQVDPSFLGVWMTGADARLEVPWWSERWIGEQARLLTHEPGAFKRLMENEWAQNAHALFTREEVASIVDPSLQRTMHGERDYWRTAFLDLGWSRDHTALVTVHKTSGGTVIVDDIYHAVGSPAQPIEYHQVEQAIIDLSRRFPKFHVVADQWGARQLIQRLRQFGVSITEVTVTGSYHDKIARGLVDLVRAGRVKVFPHDGLVKQLSAVVLKRSQAASRDDSSVKVKIDSGAGAGVAGKDDLVVALAAAAHEITEHGGSYAAVIRVDDTPKPSNTLAALRADKTERRRQELAGNIH